MKEFKDSLGGLILAGQYAFAYPTFQSLPKYNPSYDWLNPEIWSRADKPALRILPLGASITYGTLSTDGNGYRKYLRDQLRFDGYSVNMIGSQRHGSMHDNDNEGWPSFLIVDVHDKAKLQYAMKPNLVLVNAGTNDCIQRNDIVNAPARMKDLVNDLFNNIPGVTVILSGLMPNAQVGTCTQLLDNEYSKLVRDLQGQKKKVVFADLNNGYMTLDDLGDGTHPNDFGYKKMASVWWDAFQRAVNIGYLAAPEDNGLSEVGTAAVCDKVLGIQGLSLVYCFDDGQ